MCRAILALPGLDFVGGTHFDANTNSNAQIRPCSNETTSTSMKTHVATNVATPKHTRIHRNT